MYKNTGASIIRKNFVTDRSSSTEGVNSLHKALNLSDFVTSSGNSCYEG